MRSVSNSATSKSFSEGVWYDVLATFYRPRDAEGLIDREQWNVDGSNIRAHRYAGGATNSDPLEPEDHGLGYSKGGFGTKLHLTYGAGGRDYLRQPWIWFTTPCYQDKSPGIADV